MPSDSPPIDLGAIVRDGKLQISRALAIEQYARLESALSRLLAALLGTGQAKASIVFFNLINTSFRNATFAALITATHRDTYKTFWHGQAGQPGVPRVRGLLALIRELDEERNRIVHWHTVQSVGPNVEGVSIVEEYLMKPEFWLREPAATPDEIRISDLEEFARKADFASRLVTMFWMFTSSRILDEDARKTWSQIFQLPVPYPPPDTHPLYPTFEALGSPPQSSQG